MPLGQGFVVFFVTEWGGGWETTQGGACNQIKTLQNGSENKSFRQAFFSCLGWGVVYSSGYNHPWCVSLAIMSLLAHSSRC